MGFAKVYSAQASLLRATIISVEADTSRGLHSFSIVGLPDKAIEEAKDRISSAIKNSGFASPKSKNHKVVLSLAPADIKKEGPVFDVPMALAYLLATDEIRFNSEKRLFFGELALDGKMRPISGVLPLARAARDAGFTEIYLPLGNAEEAALIDGITIYAVQELREILHHINKKKDPESIAARSELLPYTPKSTFPISSEIRQDVDFSDVRGQEQAKRALLISAAGGHNCTLCGPPGTGKTMLAKAFCGILPNLTFEESLDVTSIHSVSKALSQPFISRPPFRSPHHTSSYSAIIGGGSGLRPGELTLAHRGVLFLDEFPEFDRRVIDALRQPLEERSVTIARSKGTITFPAHCILILAMNPCPCGNADNPERECTCAASTISHYQKRVSGPIIDRIDLWTTVGMVDRKSLQSNMPSGKTTKELRESVYKARAIQERRFIGHTRKIKTNSDLNAHDIFDYSNLLSDAEKMLARSAEQLKLSVRAYHRIIKIARTIADLEEKEKIDVPSILEAIQYRPHINGS
jgi:magnesium chelatase family protein